jgi:NADH-quinone oxidoreductase subunit J
LIVLELIAVLGAANFGLDQVPVPEGSDESNTKTLGRLLYTVYVYPFEIASVILTVAIVAAITLTLRPNKRKTQDPAEQVKVRSKDRVRLVKMASEKRQDGKGKP